MNKNKMKQIDYKEFADYLLDYLCNFEGSDRVIELLIGAGYDADQLEDLGFDREDVDRIFGSQEEVMDMKAVVDMFIEVEIGRQGVLGTIVLLIENFNFNKAQLLELGFFEKDIDLIIN